MTADGCEVITKFPAEELLEAGQRYFAVSGPLPTKRDSQSHLNTPIASGRPISLHGPHQRPAVNRSETLMAPVRGGTNLVL